MMPIEHSETPDAHVLEYGAMKVIDRAVAVHSLTPSTILEVPADQRVHVTRWSDTKGKGVPGVVTHVDAITQTILVEAKTGNQVSRKWVPADSVAPKILLVPNRETITSNKSDPVQIDVVARDARKRVIDHVGSPPVALQKETTNPDRRTYERFPKIRYVADGPRQQFSFYSQQESSMIRGTIEEVSEDCRHTKIRYDKGMTDAHEWVETDKVHPPPTFIF